MNLDDLKFVQADLTTRDKRARVTDYGATKHQVGIHGSALNGF